jgi:predicted DCC family thiol-disulfide oxidoreductase YuxK
MHPSQPIIFYDGLCGLCDKSVQFILKHDKHERFLFCALQSNYAQEVLGNNISFDSFILYDNGKVYTQSTGALLTLKKLGGFWQLLYALVVIPAFIRNTVYKYIAKNRYQWFGKYDVCKVPTPQQKKSFIV